MPQIFTLSNGLTVIYKKRLESPIVAFSLRFIAGSMYENQDEVGIAHFLEHILFDGTEKYPSKQKLAQFIDEKGGVKNGVTSKETVEYVVKILKDEIDVAFEYLSQITLHPLISQNEIGKEKKIIEQEINRIKSDPKLFSYRLFYSLLFPGTRLGGLNTGDIDNIQKINRENLTAFFQKMYSAKNAVLSIVGDLPFEKIQILAKTYFERMKSGKQTPLMNISTSAIPYHIEILPHISQATLILGWKGVTADSDQRFALDIISRILTKGNSSRLYARIRGEKALAYSIVSENTSARNHGLFTINVGVSEDKITECQEIIKEEIEKLCRIQISKEELEKVFTLIKSGLLFSFEDSLSEASYYSLKWCACGATGIEDELKQYEKICNNPRFILETAQKILDEKPSILLLTEKNNFIHLDQETRLIL